MPQFSSFAVCRSRRWASTLMRLATLVALITLAVPMHASTERAIKSRVAPVYPEIAKRLHVAGVVKLEVKVDAEGKVTDVKTISGNHALAIAAEDAVHKWRFVSAPADTTEDVDVNFDMNQ